MSDNLPAGATDDAAPQLTPQQAISNLRQTEDAGDRYYAAWWIGRFGVDTPAAVEALLIALKDDRDRDTDGGFPLRRNAARALGKVGNSPDQVSDPEVIPALIECLSCSDYYVREAAAQSLALLRAQVAVNPLVAMLAGGVKAAVAVPGKPHLVQPYNAILESLGMLGTEQLAETVEPFVRHEVPQVRNGAARAMYQLTAQNKYAEIIVETLSCDDLQLRRSALLDLGEMGYFPAAEAIAQTLAENSIKLISLKNILERQIGSTDALLSHETRQVMSLMDALL